MVNIATIINEIIFPRFSKKRADWCFYLDSVRVKHLACHCLHNNDKKGGQFRNRVQQIGAAKMTITAHSFLIQINYRFITWKNAPAV